MATIIPKEVVIFEDGKGNQPFTAWLETLDIAVRARIENRLLRLHLGNYGDHKTLQEGVNELRLHFGSGYRIYFAEDGKTLVILLSGGDKGTQAKDIKKAISYWKEYKENRHG